MTISSMIPSSIQSGKWTKVAFLGYSTRKFQKNRICKKKYIIGISSGWVSENKVYPPNHHSNSKKKKHHFRTGGTTVFFQPKVFGRKQIWRFPSFPSPSAGVQTGGLPGGNERCASAALGGRRTASWRPSRLSRPRPVLEAPAAWWRTNPPIRWSFFGCLSSWTATLTGKRLQKTMENHHFSWGNPLFLWWFSIVMLNYQRVPSGND